MELTQHPLSAAFPSMSADDFAALVQDVKANGQREPIMLLDGMVLDGWHRYRACTEAGIKPQTFTFPQDKDPVAFVLSHNLHRRHLTPSQRAAAVVACTEWAPAHRPKKGETVSPLSKTNADMAKQAHVSDRTIKDAKAAHKAGLGEAVKEGAMTAHEAAKVARGKTANNKPKHAEKPAKRTIEQRPADVEAPSDDDALIEAKHALADLADENEKLRDRLAVEAIDASEEEKTAAAALIAELRARVKALEAELSAVKASRDTYMRESGEKDRQINYWRKQAEKAAKAAA